MRAQIDVSPRLPGLLCGRMEDVRHPLVALGIEDDDKLAGADRLGQHVLRRDAFSATGAAGKQHVRELPRLPVDEHRLPVF